MIAFSETNTDIANKIPQFILNRQIGRYVKTSAQVNNTTIASERVRLNRKKHGERFSSDTIATYEVGY